MEKIWKSDWTELNREHQVKPVIAVDGTLASGKGTISRRLAKHYGYAYLDTGLLYRVIAHKGLNLAVVCHLSMEDLMGYVMDTPEKELRSDEVGQKASLLALQTHIRDRLNKLQRKFARNPGEEYRGAVLDGRDIGTVVAPNANCKLFVTASPEIRTQRRFQSLQQINPRITYEEVYENLIKRDRQDSSRPVAPLVFTDDYTLIDTTNSTIEESLKEAIDACAAKIATFENSCIPVRSRRLELPRSFPHSDLNAMRLPVPPRPQRLIK